MDHAATARRLYDLINAGDVEGSASIWQTISSSTRRRPALRRRKTGSRRSSGCNSQRSPDLHMAVEDVVANGDKVVARVRYTGTNRGEFMAMPATGKSVDVQLIDMFRFGDDGLVREHWGVLDALAMMQQLGVVPAGPPA